MGPKRVHKQLSREVSSILLNTVPIPLRRDDTPLEPVAVTVNYGHPVDDEAITET